MGFCEPLASLRQSPLLHLYPTLSLTQGYKISQVLASSWEARVGGNSEESIFFPKLRTFKTSESFSKVRASWMESTLKACYYVITMCRDSKHRREAPTLRQGALEDCTRQGAVFVLRILSLSQRWMQNEGAPWETCFSYWRGLACISWIFLSPLHWLSNHIELWSQN